MSNKLTYLFIVLVMFSSSVLIGQSMVVDRVVAKVGSEFITLSDVEEEYQYILTTNPGIKKEVRCEMLQSAIAQKVLIYQAKLDSVEVTDEEVEAQLDLRFQNVLRQMNGDENLFKEYYGASVKEMKDRYRDDQEQKILAERMQYQLIQQVSITPEEVLEFFNEIPKDSLPFLNSEVELSEIIMEPEVNDTEKAKALAEAEEVHAKVIAGENFEELAKKHSDDIESAKRGGDLGYARRGIYVPEF